MILVNINVIKKYIVNELQQNFKQNNHYKRDKLSHKFDKIRILFISKLDFVSDGELNELTIYKIVHALVRSNYRERNQDINRILSQGIWREENVIKVGQKEKY